MPGARGLGLIITSMRHVYIHRENDLEYLPRDLPRGYTDLKITMLPESPGQVSLVKIAAPRLTRLRVFKITPRCYIRFSCYDKETWEGRFSADFVNGQAFICSKRSLLVIRLW